MYNQKFNPYGGFPSKNNQQLYEQQYEEQQSQPLVEEVDDSYEPTDKQVREYAIETLGMRFPEDEGMLYLAREGLKAPLPDNWVPYQGRDGEVYYKHRITQEKTYDHPTDLEYRKKYEQQKEKMARKNLKSMNMKASNQLGIGPASNILNNNASNLFGSKMSNSNMFSGNAISSVNESVPSIKLDPRIQQQYEEQLEKYEERLKREWRQFEAQQRQRSENKIKKIKQDYEAQINKIYTGKQKQVRIEDKLKEQKDKIRQKIEENLQESLKDQLKDYERQSQQKTREFSSVYQQDMHLKVNKYQQQKDNQFYEKQRKIQEMTARLARQKESKKKEIEDTLKRLKSQFENGQNREIQAATADALQQELHSIKTSYAQKIKDKQAEFDREYGQTKRILGFDQNAYLSELASKKGRIKNISQQKIESYKKKQMQSFTVKCQNDLQQAQRALKEKLSNEFSLKLMQERQFQEQRISKQKQKIDKEIRMKSEANIENVYEQMKTKIKIYETDMNKKLANVQQKFINDIHGKSKGQSKDITYRIQLKQKQMSIDNKSMLISSLKRQIQLQNVTLQLMRLQSELYKCKDEHQVDQRLIKLSKINELQYRSDKYLKFQSIYKELKEKCKKDKQFLASVMGSLQNYKGPNGIGSQTILKQYNQDVRIMRENEQMLRKMQSLLKRAQINDKSAIEELSEGNLEYKQIQLKRQMIRVGSASSQIQEISYEKMANRPQQTFSRTKDIQTALKDHSKFLSSMRSELNRKLYHIRCSTYY